MSNYKEKGLQTFYGGQSVDRKVATDNQFYYAQHIDFRKSPGKFTVLPGTRQISTGDVTDLIQDIAQVPSGIRYALGDAGSVYKVSTAGVWSPFGNLGQAGGAGIIYRADVDMAYVTGTTSVGRIKLPSTALAWQPTWFQNGISNASTCYKTGGTNTYTLPTSIQETANNMRTFVTDIEPIYKIGVKVVVKGTGDWTLTVHDDANNNLGSATVTNSNLINGQINYFVFSTPIRALVSVNNFTSSSSGGRTYHFHVTSTVADGTLQTTTANSLADCDMELWANALVQTKNGLHPTINFTNLTLIGNERYVASYEPLQDLPTTADFQRHRLTLPPGFEVCGFAQKNLLCVIGAEKRSTTGEFQEGALFFWDGIGTTYNDWWPVPEGSPEALFSSENTVYFIAGGSLYRLSGTDQPVRVRAFRGTDSEYSNITDTTHVNPNVMTVRRGILLMGYPTQTTNQALEHAVYSLGAVSREYPEAFGTSYSLSTGSQLNNGSNNLRIGMVKSYGDTLYVSWRDDSNSPQKYGVDIVDNNSTPAGTFTTDLNYFDLSIPFHRKKGGKIGAVFNALPSGVSFRLKYKLDQEANWHYSDYFNTVGSTTAVMPIPYKYSGIEVGLEGTITGTTTPEFKYLGHFYDPMIAEAEFN